MVGDITKSIFCRGPAFVVLLAMFALGGCGEIKKYRKPALRKAPVVPTAEGEGRVNMDDLLGTRVEKTRGDLKPYVVKATASSRDGRKFPPEYAFDGNEKTRWASTWEDGQWLEAQFDRTVGVEEITIHWETARAADFGVSLLNSRSEWIEVGRSRGASGDTDSIALGRPLRASGIRITCDRRATKWGNSIFEVDLLGTAEGPPPEENLLGFLVPPNEWEKRERNLAERLLADSAADPATSQGMGDEAFLDLVSRRSFEYFWCETNPENGLTKDRGRNFQSSEEQTVASVAAVGFALTAYVIGAERGWVSREEALARTRTTLKTFESGPVRNIHGFFPHFVDLFSGEDTPGTEISTIDTALFLAGMITAMEYFHDPEVNQRSRVIFDRVDWRWGRHNHEYFVSHGLDAQGHFLGSEWGSTTEGLLIYLLAMGSTTHPLSAESWYALHRPVDAYDGYRFVVEYPFQTLFPYRYPDLWYDFRGRTDRKGIDYFENTTRSALAMRAYCIREASRFPKSYGPDLWGVSPADGPGDVYMIYGFPPGDPAAPTDGTIVVHAIGGSMPFIPQHAIRALRALYDQHHDMWGKYGYADSINPTVGFIARDAIGLDTGTILLGIENYRSGAVWDLFMQSPWTKRATTRIGWARRPRPIDPLGPIDLAREGTWRLHMGEENVSAPDLDDTIWTSVVVPDRLENAGPTYAEYDGSVWYRVTFGLDGERLERWRNSGRPVYLSVEAIDDYDIAYVNGRPVGQTREGPQAFLKKRRYPVPLTAVQPGRNVIAFHVMDTGGSGGIWLGPVELGPK